MRITHATVVRIPQRSAHRGKLAGFTLIELMIAMTVFLVIGGAAMSLFRNHVSQFTTQQNQVGLNTSLRNALTQMEVDVANAGTGYYTTVDKASFPIGITITSGGGAVACNVGQTYPAACFDQLNILSVDSSTPPGQGDDGTGNGCTNTTAAAALVIPPAATVINPATGAPWTTAQYAAKFAVGDQILFASGLNYNTAVVTAAGGVAGADVSIAHQPTSGPGLANGNVTDPLLISSVADPNLTTSFCAGLSWVVKLAAPVIYGVDTATNPANPVLYRKVGAGGAQVPIADQIIGFRLVTSLLNCTSLMTIWPTAPAVPQCNGNPTNFNQIRAVQISLIGRTPPLPSSPDTFHNTFDQGPYRIEAVSVTANPRNLSMND
jgi:prepilin-type N-terminal cleavage/methylation domain-containing protein